MVNLTFGEQVKILLSRKNMTIKELAEIMEVRTGKKMSRQNLTQRLGRDNFQEQDMRIIADILECPFQLSILGTTEMQEREDSIERFEPTEKELHKINKMKMKKLEKTEEVQEVDLDVEREVTIGELAELFGEDDTKVLVTNVEETTEKVGAATTPRKIEWIEEEKEDIVESLEMDLAQEASKNEKDYKDESKQVVKPIVRAAEHVEESQRPVQKFQPEYQEVARFAGKNKRQDKEIAGEVNPYTGKEYATNSVRMHAKRIGYVQVYDRGEHKWTDMTEWAFLGYQERKKALLGKEYTPPVYLD